MKTVFFYCFLGKIIIIQQTQIILSDPLQILLLIMRERQ